MLLAAHKAVTSLALVFFVVIAAAADESKVKPLTRQEITNGWLQLFDGESLFGWTRVGESKWTVADGAFTPEDQKSAILVSTAEFSEFALQVEYRAHKEPAGKILFLSDHQGQSDFALKLAPCGNGWSVLTVRVSGAGWAGELRPLDRSTGGDQSFKGTKPITKPRGHIGFTGTGFDVRSVRIRPLNAQTLFNGKDLTGWKVFPGDKYKSVFSVTKDGAINVKNGPGDLQTEGQWADFVLQLECISNGKHLNSGVFFRALPEQYQQGYEAQIRNEFKDEESQEYMLEVYDPKTNELKEKIKAKYAAVDFGTGAIYRRQPARKSVARDGEWFSLTVMANGRHLATWVDGVPVADWTDYRPLNANGRNGCRLEKGCISFQGHDPTTDLSFRNIRLAELPSK